MAKTNPISIRVTEEMDKDLGVLASLLRVDKQDVYRLALGDILLKYNDKITKERELFNFKYLKEKCWHPLNNSKFVYFSTNIIGDKDLRLVEVFSDGEITGSEYRIFEGTTYSDIMETINSLELDSMINDKMCIYDRDSNEILESEADSESIIIDMLCDYKGKMFFNERYRTNMDKDIILKDIGIN